MKRYKDHEHLKGICHDCGMASGDFVDLVISDEIWEKINPTYQKGAGLLCPNCIGLRIRMLDIKITEAVFP